METITEAAKNYSFRSVCQTAFKAGVEFAKCWYDVKKELPNEYQPVLFKTSDDCLYLGIYSTDKEYGNWFKSTDQAYLEVCVDLDGEKEVVSWQPIELN